MPRSNRVGTWRFEVRSAKRFRPTTLRTVTLKGVDGVKLIAGKLLETDHEFRDHAFNAMVPQTVIFDKSKWPDFRAALGWQASHFTRLENPPRSRSKRNPPKGSIPQIESAYNDGYNNGRIDKGTGRRSEYMWHAESDDSLEHSDSGVRWRTASRMGYRDGFEGKPRRRDFGPERRTNPPKRLQAFKAGAVAAVEELVKAETELTSLFHQAVEIAGRGEKVPEWLLQRVHGLQLEKRAKLENVRTAVARHGAAIEEFSPASKTRRKNPSGAKAEAVERYREFHGRDPSAYHLERVPDLSQLVTLGRALRIDYQLDRENARGSRNTPYQHEFSSGSTLLTDPTGTVLVIVGNVKVSRAPRGRFGYIRTAAGG